MINLIFHLKFFIPFVQNTFVSVARLFTITTNATVVIHVHCENNVITGQMNISIDS